MPLQISAIYENGVLKPDAPLPYKEREQLVLTVKSRVDLVKESAGMIPWNGDEETLRKFAEGEDLDPQIAS